MIGIDKIVSIGHLPSFQVENVWEILENITEDSELIAPEYKSYIPASSLRRYSPILRFSLTAALSIQQSLGDIKFDAISIGTGLGCLVDTEKFLQQVLTTKSTTLSPTSFIHSTHNTIGGAISMALQHRGYNMTHTQKYLSFEWALLDGMMKIKEGNKNVLIGGADEYIPLLQKVRSTLIESDSPLSSGATFLNLQESSDVYIKDLSISYQNNEQDLKLFLQVNEISEEEIDLILYAKNCPIHLNKQSFLPYTGIHQCSVGFAYHMAVDAIRHQGKKMILVINDQSAKATSFGLIVEG